MLIDFYIPRKKIISFFRMRKFFNNHNIECVYKMDKLFGYCAQIGRFRIFHYWSQISEEVYNAYFNDYDSAYIPILMCCSKYSEEFIECADDSYYFSGYDYQEVDDYYDVASIDDCYKFIAPAFVLSNNWGSHRDWEFTPTIYSAPDNILKLLRKEKEHGGWKKNFRGRPLIPKRARSRHLSRPKENGEGWASYKPTSAT